jgi:predicted kinase
MQTIIFSGVQGSGKSTFFKTRFFDTHIRINMDMLRTRHRETLLMQACLEMQQPFVVDNTNPTIEVRAKYIQAARAARFQVVGYYFLPDLTLSLQRNAARSGRQRVPDKGVVATFRKFQPPTFEEGFDLLYTVRTSENGGFEVEPVQNI